MTLADEICDVYEMTPTQAGMLFESLYQPESGRYVQQYWGRLEGPLDTEAFRAAWQAVIQRHDILRAQCHWEDLDRPALAIHRAADPAWSVEDWSDDPCAQDRLANWLESDRAQGFDMTAVPLMRFALIRMAPDSHVFVWTFHHLLLDGWCGALLVREVMELYGGGRPGHPPPPFRAYVEWREMQDTAAARDHWSALLAGVDGATPLGIDRPGPEGFSEHRFHLTPDLSRALAATARRERLTLATLMQAAWGLVLSRYSGQEDVVFGTVLSGRPADLPGAEEMVGLFLQTVPVRLTIGDDTETGPWLRELLSAQAAREAHGHLPLNEIRAAAGMAGSSPLFDSLLIVETYPESIGMAVNRGGTDLRLTQTGVDERTNYPLTIKVLPGERIEISLVADTSRVPADRLPRLQRHLSHVLDTLAFGQVETLGEIDVLDPAEHALIAEAGQGPTPPEEQPAPVQLAARAEAQPEASAVEIPGGLRLTYADLMARSGAIAAGLLDRGVVPGDLVAICQDRTPDLLATMIAIWRCGAAYLPLDPIYPPDRIAFILEDAGAALAVVDDIGQGSLPDTGQVLHTRDCPGQSDTWHDTSADDLAYVLYTSGSTGRPKGVPIPHGALANFLGSMRDTLGLKQSDRLLAVTTVAFDIAALELIGPLITGGTVVIAPTGAGMDGKALARTIEAERIGIMQATPAGWRVLRDSGWQGTRALRIVSGGEALDSALAADLLGLGAELWNLYGPTETTIWSAALRVTPAHLEGAKVPVGGPIARTTLSVRDAQHRPVPVGVPGELWIGGAGLSPGYLKRPELTADRFVTLGDGRHYRTGDRVRWTPEGTLDFLGRFDDQVKLRGYRIELGEIERQLEAHESVAQAVVVVRGEGNAARLVAYIRCPGTPPAPGDLRASLEPSLPGYMIPGSYVSLDRFPLTPNGKIDRKALPAPGGPAGGSSAMPGGSQQDDLVAAIWADVLGVPGVVPGDGFFELGGHSLAALRIIGEVRRHLGVDLTLRDLLEAPTFRTFTARIAEGGAVLPPVVPSVAPPVLSSAQHRQWLLARLEPDRRDYHLSLGIRLHGPLDADRLEQALTSVANRHAALRSRFPSERGVASVEVLAEAGVRLQHDRANASEDLDRIHAQEAGGPFDMEAAPPWRARLVNLGDTEHVLILTFHHIVMDEWSFSVLLRDLTAAYLGEEALPLSVQYPDFAAWQRSLDLGVQGDFWQRQLAGAPAVITLPADRPRPAMRDGVGGRVALSLDPETTAGLEVLARENGATLFMCLLAAYSVFLERHSGESDLVIGTPVSNRRMAEFQDMVGLFVNTLAIRTGTGRATDFPDAIARVRDAVLAAHANQDIPFEQVIDRVVAPRSGAHAPLVQTAFAMPDVPQSGRLGPDLRWEALPGTGSRARFDLSLDLARTDRGLEGQFDYAADIFDAETVERLARRFERFLQALPAQGSAPLDSLSVLSAEDHRIAMPDVARTLPGSPLDWLARRAETIPDAPVWDGCTFAALHQQVEAVSRGGETSTGQGPEWIPRCLAALQGGSYFRTSDTLFDADLFTHLAGLIGEVPAGTVIRTGAEPGSIAGLTALAVALRSGAEIAFDGSPDMLEIGTRRLSFGTFGTDEADVLSLPEYPGAFLSGRAAPGVRALVLDARDTPVPPGGTGWLALGGRGLARGYAGDPARTAARFRPNPHIDPRDFDEADLCLLDTGLRVRLAFDGTIEPVADAAERILLGATDTTAQRPWEAPEGEVETALARIWSAVLSVDRPGRHDGFFELGGDSILAMQVVARAAEAGFALEPRDLFLHPTLAGLAAVVRPVDTAPSEPEALPGMDDVDLDEIAGLVSFGDE